MKDNDNGLRQRRFIDNEGYPDGSVYPFQEQGARSDDWVKELQSILHTQENPLAISCAEKNANQKKESLK
jgi:hypothetical protein